MVVPCENIYPNHEPFVRAVFSFESKQQNDELNWAAFLVVMIQAGGESQEWATDEMRKWSQQFV